jgi:hypothetical protein
MNFVKISCKLSFTFLAIVFVSTLFAQAPVITQQPNNLVKCIGNSGQIILTATGAEPLSYQWFKDGAPFASGSAVLDFPALSELDEGEYYCNVSNGEGNVNSFYCEVQVVNGIPVINDVSTESDFVCLGTDNLFEADVVGEYMQVIWYFEGLVSDYGANYNLSSAQLSDEGIYYCVASNACGSVQSVNLSIDIVVPANITVQPVTTTVCQGEDVTFFPIVEGDYLNFIWMRNDVLLPSEQNNSITINDVVYPHTYYYNLIAYNLCDHDTSNTVYITVNNLPQIVGQPIDHSECPTDEITLYAYAGGTTEAFYQWYELTDGLIDGAIEDSFAVPMTSGDTSYYYCVMTNVCGSVNSDTASVIIKQAPIITQQPTGAEVCVGQNLNIQVKAAGTEPLFYQWLFNGADVNGANIDGDNEETIHITAITSGQFGMYSCHVTNECGFVVSDEVEVIVNVPPLVAEQPEDVVVCEGEEFTIDITSQGTEPIEFEWYILETSTLLGNEEDYSSDAAIPENSGSYYCILSNMCGDLSTDTVSVEIRSLPQVLTNPEGLDVCVGDYVEMSITANGSEPLDFLWYRNGSSVSSQTNSTLSISAAQVNQTGTYFCRVMNDCGYEDSETAQLTIGTAPAITWHPINQTLCELETLNLIMDAQGDNYNLQWYFNDMPIPGENDTVLNFTQVDESYSGSFYCLAYNACATVSTDTVDVVIHPAPELDLGDDIDLCDGVSVTIGPTEVYVHYSWNNGANNQTLEVSSSGVYILDVTGINSCHNYDTIVVTFHQYHQILFAQDTVVACGPYVINAGAGAYSYLWSTTPPQTTQTITVNSTGTYSVTCTGDSFGCSSSGSVFIDSRTPISFNLGNDVSAPVDSFVNIGIGHIYSEYLWNTGFTGSTLTVYGSDYGTGTYQFWLTAYALNGCSDTDTINVTFYNDSGIEEAANKETVAIYPNPATDFVVFKSEDFAMTSVEFYNISGELVSKEIINSWEFSFNVSNFAKGLYFVNIRGDENKSQRRKILIQ